MKTPIDPKTSVKPSSKPRLLKPTEIVELRDEMKTDGKWMNKELKRGRSPGLKKPAL